MEQGKERRNVDIILDTEFNMRVGDFRIDPISIALVDADSGSYVYGVSNEFNLEAAKRHKFVAEHVLPKLPPQNHWQSNEKIAEDIRGFFKETAERTQANRATIWAKNGGMGDFALLALFLKDELYPFMQSLGVERTFIEDTQKLYMDVGRPKLDLPEIPEDKRHTALGDALHEREVFLACQKIRAAREAAPK